MRDPIGHRSPHLPTHSPISTSTFIALRDAWNVREIRMAFDAVLPTTGSPPTSA